MQITFRYFSAPVFNLLMQPAYTGPLTDKVLHIPLLFTRDQYSA